ncbi:MAG: hypothetical protein UZ19_OD1000669 [Parcubacteria bacterium OLB19]|nr:MAG: hypothetical protein UZ19_OD1000669 [Parcubacteria bacterium OLB19]
MVQVMYLQKLFNSHTLSFFSLAILFVVVHGWLFFKYQSWLVLGFDTGFYRRYLLEPLTSIPHASVPGLDHTVIIPRVFIDVFRLTGLSTDVVLYGSYILAIIILLISFYFFVKEIFTKKIAYLATILLILSPVYFHAFWFFLFKNFLALSLFFWLLISIRRKSWWLIIFLSLAIPVTHQSTTVIAGVIVFVYAVILFWRKENFWLPLGSWFILTSIYLIYHPTVSAKLSAPPVAVFIDWSNFIQMIWPLLVLVLAGFWATKDRFFDKNDLISWSLVVILFLAFSLPYHERVFLFAIFPLAILGAVILSRLNLVKILIVLFLFLFFWIYSIQTYSPYFSSAEVRSLQTLESLNKNDNVITPNFMAPWVHGYTVAKVFAPGVFKDPYSPIDWELYWSHNEPSYDRAFLNAFPQPLYFYIPKGQEYFLPEQVCVNKINDALYLYICNKNDYE